MIESFLESRGWTTVRDTTHSGGIMTDMLILLLWVRHLYAPVERDKSLITYKPFELKQTTNESNF